jgi:hypothetical protein
VSFGVVIKVSPGTSAKEARAIRAFVADKTGVHRAAAKGALPVVQRNFVRLAGTNRNRFGARGGFWNRMLGGTRATADETSGSVQMPPEVALRFFGGRVTPKTKKYMPIPLRKEAYGKSPKEFANIKFARIGGKLFAFTTDLRDTGTPNETTGARSFRKYRARTTGRRRITLLFLLTKSATIKPDKSVLPTDEVLGKAAANGVEAALRGARARATQSKTTP